MIRELSKGITIQENDGERQSINKSINNSTNNNNNEQDINQDIDCVTSMDINTIGSYLLSATEKGYVYLWDAFLSFKNIHVLYEKFQIENDSILSIKFIKTKQFRSIQNFMILTKSGKILIYFIVSKEPGGFGQPEARKKVVINLIYEKKIFNDEIKINTPLNRFNIYPSIFLNISFNNNIFSASWPIFEEKKNKEKNEIFFNSLDTKYYFLYNSIYPKINYPSSIQLRNKFYEMYIPIQGQPNFENKIYYADNYFVYLYDISTSRHRKLINYSK